MTTQITTDPEHIAVSKSRGIEIDWKDGHHSSYGIDYLRDWCPCATCAGTHGTEPRPKTTTANSGAAAKPANPFQIYKPRERMLNIEPVGNYALRIKWADGHDAGIYSYSHLRQICPCQVCEANRQTPV